MDQRLRYYGEPADRRYEIALDKQTDAIAFSRSGSWSRWVDYQVALARDYATEEEDAALARETASELRPLSAVVATGLPRCEAFYVDEDVCDLLEAARHTLPPVELRPSDLLVPCGFVWLAKPLPDFVGDESLTGFGWIIDDAETTASFFYTQGLASRPWPSPIQYPGAGKVEDYDYPVARLEVAFWLLAKQRLLGQNREDVGRAVRRRAKIQEIKSVVVVSLRRKAYPETEGTRKVDWTHRWVVRGFWRNQWYPSENRHRPVWIADHVKGPSDKPFVAKRRAFEFVR